MRNECNMIKDILPLYIEDMVSDDTAEFVKEHLEKCDACRTELENMKNPGKLEPAVTNTQEDGSAPFRALKRRWNKRNLIVISTTVLITALAVLLGSYFIGSGFSKRTDVVLADYSVSEDGTELTFYTSVPTSMGYIRGFKDHGGGVKPHYLTFYCTFGGLNSSFGAKHEFGLELDETDTEIWFNRADGGYELVLEKNVHTGEWVRPTE